MLCIIKLDKFDHSQAQLSLVQSADLWCQVLRINQTRVGLANKPDKCAKTLIAESIACLMMRKQFHKSAGRARWVSWALALAQLSLKLNENGVMDALGADKFLSVSIMSVSSSLGSRGGAEPGGFQYSIPSNCAGFHWIDNHQAKWKNSK